MDSEDKPLKEKLKILCLHGYRQNGDLFKSKIGKIIFNVDTISENPSPQSVRMFQARFGSKWANMRILFL